MSMQITNSLAAQRLQSLYSQSNASSSASSSTSNAFSDMLNQVMEQTGATENEAQKQATSLLTGETDSIHSVVLASEKAEVALQLTLQIRNKVLDAYNEVMRMQI